MQNRVSQCHPNELQDALHFDEVGHCDLAFTKPAI